MHRVFKLGGKVDHVTGNVSRLFIVKRSKVKVVRSRDVSAARLVFRLRRYDHVTDVLAILHWLRLPERVNFKLWLMAYRVLNGMAPSYLNLLVTVSNLPGRRRLRSSFTQQLLVPPYHLSTVGRRSFSVAASTFWNTLPNDIQSAPSLSSFRRQLKTFLFHQSFPDIIL